MSEQTFTVQCQRKTFTLTPDQWTTLWDEDGGYQGNVRAFLAAEGLIDPYLYVLPDYRWSELRGKIEKLQKRAVKLGLPAIQVEERGVEEVIRYRDEAVHGKLFPVIKRYVSVRVQGAPPQLQGFHLAGVIEHKINDVTGGVFNVLRNVPDQEIDERFRTARPWCDHCQTSRRRADTVVVQMDSGEQLQVGKQCLKDFLGHGDPKALLGYAETAWEIDTLLGGEDNEDMDRDERPGGRVKDAYDPESFLGQAAYFARTKGFVSATKAREAAEKDDYSVVATSARVLNNLEKAAGRVQDRHGNRVLPEVIEEQDAQFGKDALAWVRGWTEQDYAGSTYLANLYAVCCQHVVTERRDLGLLTSLVSVYFRHLEAQKEAAKPEVAAKPVSQHIGVVGQRSEHTFTVTRITPLESEFGVRYVVGLRDEQGNEAVWFASSASALQVYSDRFPQRHSDLQVDGVYRAKATVKEHDYYKGTAQTKFQRLSVVEVVDDPRFHQVTEAQEVAA